MSVKKKHCDKTSYESYILFQDPTVCLCLCMISDVVYLNQVYHSYEYSIHHTVGSEREWGFTNQERGNMKSQGTVSCICDVN